MDPNQNQQNQTQSPPQQQVQPPQQDMNIEYPAERGDISLESSVPGLAMPGHVKKKSFFSKILKVFIYILLILAMLGSAYGYYNYIYIPDQMNTRIEENLTVKNRAFQNFQTIQENQEELEELDIQYREEEDREESLNALQNMQDTIEGYLDTIEQYQIELNKFNSLESIITYPQFDETALNELNKNIQALITSSSFNEDNKKVYEFLTDQILVEVLFYSLLADIPSSENLSDADRAELAYNKTEVNFEDVEEFTKKFNVSEYDFNDEELANKVSVYKELSLDFFDILYGFRSDLLGSLETMQTGFETENQDMVNEGRASFLEVQSEIDETLAFYKSELASAAQAVWENTGDKLDEQQSLFSTIDNSYTKVREYYDGLNVKKKVLGVLGF